MSEEKKADGQPEQAKFIGGEVTISADPVTGAISVSHPTNVIIALGLLEVGKAIMLQRQAEQQKRAELQAAKNPPAILRADQGTLDQLKKLSPVRPS